MEWRRLRSILLRLNNRGYGAGRPRNLVSPNMLCRRLLRLDLSAAGPCLEDVNRVEGSEPPQEPWSWEKTDDMLETGNLTAGISTLNSSISLLGNCSAQPYCVAGTSLLRQFLLAAGGSFYVCLPRLDWTMRASSRKRPGILLCRCFNPGNPERRKESAQSAQYFIPASNASIGPIQILRERRSPRSRASALADALSLFASLCLQSAKHNTGSQHQKAD